MAQGRSDSWPVQSFPRRFRIARLRESSFRRMVKAQLMPERLSRPVQKDDQGDDLDGPKLDVVNDPVRIEAATESGHKISCSRLNKRFKLRSIPQMRIILARPQAEG